MPYQRGERLPGEKASKTGHLEVVKSKLVSKLLEQFEEPKNVLDGNGESQKDGLKCAWEDIGPDDQGLDIIFGIDGSYQIIESETNPLKKIAFVKTALVRLDKYALNKLNKRFPHPLRLRDILRDSALWHATVFPLTGITLGKLNNYNSIREIIYDSLKDERLDGEIFETLKWLVFRKWKSQERDSAPFTCPHCYERVAIIHHDQDKDVCANCGGTLLVTDIIGFHLDMSDDFAPGEIASNYMNLHEMLLLLTGIRYYWENNKKVLERCLFIKDGPFLLVKQFSNLVNPIREFLKYVKGQGSRIFMMGQEKTGNFKNHCDLITKEAPERNVFIPTNEYICKIINQRPTSKYPYGESTMYGNKLFYKHSSTHSFVLNIPAYDQSRGRMYAINPEKKDFMGLDRIINTIPSLLSYRHENAIIPIELANGIASLSTYPSARILKVFAEAKTTF